MIIIFSSCDIGYLIVVNNCIDKKNSKDINVIRQKF